MSIRQGRREISNVQLDRLINCFSVLKAEDDNYIDANDIFVKTKAFEELIIRQLQRTNTVLLGRKGDGKTALLRRLNHDIKTVENKKAPDPWELFHEIDIEESYFTELINKFSSICKSIQSKHSHISSDHIAKKLWIKYLTLIALNKTSNNAHKYSLKKEHSDILCDLIKKTESELGVVIRPNTDDSSQSFLFFLQRIIEFFNCSDKTIAEDIDSKDPLMVLRDLGDEFQIGSTIVKESGLNLTLAIDKFDDFIDRMVSNDMEQTRILRRHFLHGIIGALNEMERQKNLRWLRIVVCLPEDLVVDLNLREIASHKSLLYVEIKWTVSDLKSILNNRIGSVLTGVTWDDLFHTVANSNKLIQKKESCSNYIIRHTTRRPREVMMHALNIFEYIRRNKTTISSEQINEIVASSNEKIVQDLILPEWKSIFTNLTVFMDRIPREEPLAVFGFWNVSSWADSDILHTLLSQTLLPPNFSLKDKDSQILICVSILYRVGVIGFRVKRRTSKKGFIKQGQDDFAKYIFHHSLDASPIYDVIRLLTSPTLFSDLESAQAKAVKSFLIDGHQSEYEVLLCFAPMFFESLGAVHDRHYIVDDITDEY